LSRSGPNLKRWIEGGSGRRLSHAHSLVFLPAQIQS
jgi:hypothetical protein